MPDCERFQKLRCDAAQLCARVRALVEEHDRLAGCTGLSDDHIVEIMERASRNRQRACTALLTHAAAHRCATGLRCHWPAGCETCGS